MFTKILRLLDILNKILQSSKESLISAMTVECLFSSLSAIDTAQRRSMTSKREADLTYLLFERKTLQSLTFNDFLKEWKKKPRKLCFD